MSFEDLIVRALNRRSRKRQTGRDGLYLGHAEPLSGGERADFVLPLSPVQHSFISGRTGSGKSTLLQRAMYERFRRALPLINIDFHGQATDELLAMAGQNAGSHPIVLFEPGSDPAIGWNPLAHGGSPYATVQELISIFHLRLWPEAWGPRLEECLKMTLLALVQAGLTLLEVTSFLSRPDFRGAVLRKVSIPEVLEFWSIRFERLSRSQQSAVIEPVLNKMSVFHDPALRYVVGQPDGALDFERALAEGHTILANLASRALRGHRFLLAALMVAKFKSAVYCQAPPGGAAYAAFFDEFQELVAIDSLDDYLRSFRKFGCSVFMATQNLALSPELKSAIFGNCSWFFCFASSAADAVLLGREFGSADGDLAAQLLPELKIGQAIVKERGAPVQLLRVTPPPIRATAELVAAGRERCLQLGKSRREIDEDIARRTSDLLRPSGSVKPSAHSEKAVAIDEKAGTLPEGYE